MIDDYHNVHAKNVPVQLVTSRAIHMASCLVDIQQVPAVLQPPNVSIHRPVKVKVKGEILVCYLTIILRNRAEYHLILSRRGRRPSWLNQGIFRKIEQDNCFIIQQIPIDYHFRTRKTAL